MAPNMNRLWTKDIDWNDLNCLRLTETTPNLQDLAVGFQPSNAPDRFDDMAKLWGRI